MSWSLTLADFWAHGLPPSACVPEARQAQSVDHASGLIELPQHGFAGGERIRLRPGSTTSAVPAGTSRLSYYTIATPSGPDFFSLVGVTMTDDGSGVITVVEDSTPWILQILASVSSYIVASHKATAGPWTTPPGWAPMIGGDLAAIRVASRLRVSSPHYKLDDLQKRAERAEAFLAKLDHGEPYSDGVGPVDATPAVAEMGAVSVSLQGRGFLECEDGRA
jgi:hypothetical protein